ncbi:MAG: hypothetical protein GX945_02650, partial [Lentisphaerae bacterium]|nr:hypothetical protein [Lentisphaerota bacterium]
FPVAAAPIISYPDTTRGTSSTSFTGSLEISIDAPDEDTVVRYTTDGSYPGADSLSESPLTITNTTVITARAFRNINGDYVPCSAITRRSFANTDEFNEAVGLGAEGFSFTTSGDQPWINKMMPHSTGEESPAVGTERLRPGQTSSLFLVFTMEEEGLVSFEQYYSEYSSSSASFVIYDADNVAVRFTKTSTRLNYSNWYKHTLNLPAGIYTAVWTLTVPDTVFDGPAIAIDNFRAGSLRCTLTLLCEPQDGGTTYANNVQGTVFNVMVDQDVSIRVEDNDHYLFTQWSDGNDNAKRTVTILDPTDLNEDPNTYTAHFVEAVYIATAAEPANGGKVNGGNKKYPLGEEVTLGAYGNSGWRFNRWLDDDDDPVTEPIPYWRSFTCTEEDRNRSYTAVFTPVIEVEAYAYYLAADSEYPSWGGGTVDGAGTYEVADVNTPFDVTLTATPESDNYIFLGWDDNRNNVIDEDEERNPVRNLSLTWADLAGDRYRFHTNALFAQAPLLTNLALTPDHGQSAADGITWLADDEELTLAFLLANRPALYVSLSYRAQGSDNFVVLHERDYLAEDSRQVSIPIALRDGGSYTLELSISDWDSYQFEKYTLPLQIDATPLSATFSDRPAKPGDADSLSVTVTFSDDIVDGEFTLDNIVLVFDIPARPHMEGLTLTRVDGKTYTVGNIRIPDDDGWFELTITLAGLHKALSGLPGFGSYTEAWRFAFDNPRYTWQAGWNAIFLPFESILPSTADGLVTMPRSRVANDAMVISDDLPLRHALWVFCAADPDNAPKLRGKFCADQEPAIPALTPGEWTFIGPLREIAVPEDTTAWEWRNGKYVHIHHTQMLRPGYAYWLLLAPWE